MHREDDVCVSNFHTLTAEDRSSRPVNDTMFDMACLIVSTVFNYRTILEQTFTFQDLIAKWKIICSWVLLNVKFGVVLITNRGTVSHCLNNQNSESSQGSCE